jgi:Transposase DDE domain
MLQDSITMALDPVKLNRLARESGFIRRESKLKPEEFIDTLMFSERDHSQLSLQDCCNDLAQQHRKSFSKVALHKRFNENSLNFVKSVLAEQMASRLNLGYPVDKWQPFNRVLVSDSCKFSLPEQYTAVYPGYGSFGKTSGMMNIQYSFDLKHGDWENLELTKATQNDQSHSKKTLGCICKGDLHIRDLGFVTQEYLAKIVREEASFLNRLNPKWKPVQSNTGKPLDWNGLYRQMRGSKDIHFETRVVIGTGKKAFHCRLIAVMVPEQVYNERIRKAQKQAKNHGLCLSDEYRERCRFSIFITNVDEQILKATDVIQLYRLRWQIELIFKNWKSLLDIHQVKVVKKERFECQLIAKFIWILLNWKIFRHIDAFIQKNSPDYACSTWKFFKQARQYSYALRKVAAAGMNFKDWCEIFLCPIIKYLVIEPKKGKQPGYKIVNDIFKPLS